jgi:hypothetical protein
LSNFEGGSICSKDHLLVSEMGLTCCEYKISPNAASLAFVDNNLLETLNNFNALMKTVNKNTETINPNSIQNILEGIKESLVKLGVE